MINTCLFLKNFCRIRHTRTQTKTKQKTKNVNTCIENETAIVSIANQNGANFGPGSGSDYDSEYDDDDDSEFSDITSDEEINAMVITDKAEIEAKSRLWSIENADYLEEQRKKEEFIRRNQELGISTAPKKKKKVCVNMFIVYIFVSVSLYMYMYICMYTSNSSLTYNSYL